MAFQDQQPGDIHATLAVSEEEARLGSSRVINLPGGRTTTVVVPAGTRDGQKLHLPGQGLAKSTGGPSGDLILRVAVVASTKHVHDDYATERSFYSDDSAAPGSAGSPAYAQSPQGPSFTSAPFDAARGGPPAYQQAGGYPNDPVYSQTLPEPQAYPGAGGMYGQVTEPQPYAGASGYPNAPAVYSQVAPQNYRPGSSESLKPKRNGAITALIIVILLVLIAGSGLVYYLGYYQPNQAHTVATQTAQSQTRATARAVATGTAQVLQATAQASATSAAQVQATAQAYQSIYTQATSGTPVLNDSMSNPTLNPLWDITLGSTANGACAFTGGSYHATIPKTGYFEPCYAESTNYSKFAFQIDMTITQGDFGGVLLRANATHSAYYLFRVGVDGSFDLYNYADAAGSQATQLLTGSSQAMKGLNQNNEITVVAQGAQMYFFLNRQYLGSTNDNTYTAGQIGVLAESAKNPTDVAFSNAKVWTL
jgi:DnaJ-like protein